MRVDILTLFPAAFAGPFSVSIVGRAIARGLLQVELHNIRDFSESKHHTVDDYPYGGGAGMVMQAAPIFAAVESLHLQEGTPIILLTPGGRLFRQEEAIRLAAQPRLVLICGHYEGVDERVRLGLAAEELSIGDYVLSGGEIPAMVVVDTVTRLLPGAIDQASTAEESHTGGLLEYPQYTRPAEFRGMAVPPILLSGNHGAVARWRREEALRRTFEQRPDLLAAVHLSPREQDLVARWETERAVAGDRRDGEEDEPGQTGP